jgi:proteasome lid subunit RPN8/RPN11
MFATRHYNSPREQCGMFIGHVVTDHARPPKRFRVIELPNRSATPHKSYVISQDDVDMALARLYATESSVIGFWHTHPAPFLPAPSEDDWDGIRQGSPAWWHAVVSPVHGIITWYDQDKNIHKQPLR